MPTAGCFTQVLASQLYKLCRHASHICCLALTLGELCPVEIINQIMEQIVPVHLGPKMHED